MSDYVIISDSTTDLTSAMISDLKVEILPLHFVIDGKSYANDPCNEELSGAEFYELLRGGKTATTVQVNIDACMTAFERHLKEGRNILYIAFSSALSGTFNSASVAAKTLSEKYPERKIIVIDSLCAAMGEGLLVYLAAEKKNNGASLQEVAAWVEENKLRVCHLFTVNDLFHLKRGGRVSSTSAMFGTMLGIKPVLNVDNDGRLVPCGKVRGRRQALDALVAKLDETGENISEQTIFISHADSEEDAQYVGEKIREKHKGCNVIISMIGPVVGAHAGPGTIALFFLGSSRG